MNLDFCFMDDARTVAVAGWTTQARPRLRLHMDDEVLTPIQVTRHVRRDLRSSEPLGLIALFDLSVLQRPGDPAKATIHLGTESDFTEIRAQRLSEDAGRLVEIGVDEVFFALLRLIAQQRLRLAGAQIGRDICARLRMAPSAGRETDNFALAVDRCQSTASGQGAVIGWFTPASASGEPLCALAMDDETIMPVDLLAGSMARPDLAGCAPRYRFTGRDGYCGSWRFSCPPSGPVRILFMVPGESFRPGVMVDAEQVDPAELAGHVAIAELGIDDIQARARLRRAMLPETLPEPGAGPVGVDVPQDRADTLLILDHDLADADLRDVLRRLGSHMPGPLRLHLLRPRLTSALRNAAEGAAREIPAGSSLAGAALRIETPARLPGRVVFARSATLFQFDLQTLLAGESDANRLMIMDPIGTAMAEPAASADRFSRDLLPFALAMDGPVFFGMLAQVPDCFLTEEARLRLVAEALIARNEATLHRADVHRFFEGRSGPFCQGFADGRDWHAHDAESRRLIQENRAA